MPQPLKKLFDYLDRDIWRIHTKKLSRRESFLIKQLRVILLAIREFRGNKCQLNASALTFYTLLSIVPIAAMAFGIAKGFGLDQILEKQLLEKFPGQEQSLTQIIGFANNLLKDTQGGLVAGVGVIVLFWTVIKVLNDPGRAYFAETFFSWRSYSYYHDLLTSFAVCDGVDTFHLYLYPDA